jgi:hypothetical protein
VGFCACAGAVFSRPACAGGGLLKPEFFGFGVLAMAAIVTVNIVYHSIKNKGLEGALFGARISGTVGELELGRTGPVSTTRKLHRLQAPELGAPTVGIEVVNRSFASDHMMPIRLTSEQATVLKELLAQAIAAR